MDSVKEKLQSILEYCEKASEDSVTGRMASLQTADLANVTKALAIAVEALEQILVPCDASKECDAVNCTNHAGECLVPDHILANQALAQIEEMMK